MSGFLSRMFSDPFRYR